MCLTAMYLAGVKKVYYAYSNEDGAPYDLSAATPFPGVDALLGQLDRWALCSNKSRASGMAELERLGWNPAVALFSDDFGGRPKVLGPVLAALS